MPLFAVALPHFFLSGSYRMHSLSLGYLAKLSFDTQQMATLRVLGEYRGKQQRYIAQPPEVLSDLRHVAVVESIESSNRLEGVVVAAHRLKSLVLKNAAPQSRSEQEVAGYRDALSLIHESGDQMPFSEGAVLQLHGILYRYMPQRDGHWKATSNDIIERHPDGSSRIRLRPVATTHLTPTAMTDMIARYRTALDQHLADPLVLVPLGTIERGRGAKGDRVRAEILKRQLPFSISEIEEACPGVSRDMVRVILRAMKAEGLIEPNGKGRGAKWQHKQP